MVGPIKIDKYNIKHCNLSTTPSKEDIMSEAYILHHHSTLTTSFYATQVEN